MSISSSIALRILSVTLIALLMTMLEGSALAAEGVRKVMTQEELKVERREPFQDHTQAS